jgi:hypothetical protein
MQSLVVLAATATWRRQSRAEGWDRRGRRCAPAIPTIPTVLARGYVRSPAHTRSPADYYSDRRRRRRYLRYQGRDLATHQASAATAAICSGSVPVIISRSLPAGDRPSIAGRRAERDSIVQGQTRERQQAITVQYHRAWRSVLIWTRGCGERCACLLARRAGQR